MNVKFMEKNKTRISFVFFPHCCFWWKNKMVWEPWKYSCSILIEKQCSYWLCALSKVLCVSDMLTHHQTKCEQACVFIPIHHRIIIFFIRHCLLYIQTHFLEEATHHGWINYPLHFNCKSFNFFWRVKLFLCSIKIMKILQVFIAPNRWIYYESIFNDS